jgi:hypothetical protein
VTVPWVVNGPGNYTITVSVKHQGDTGEDEELVAAALLAVEYLIASCGQLSLPFGAFDSAL